MFEVRDCPEKNEVVNTVLWIQSSLKALALGCFTPPKILFWPLKHQMPFIIQVLKPKKIYSLAIVNSYF